MTAILKTTVIPFASNETVISADHTDSSVNLYSRSWLSPDAVKDFIGEFSRFDLIQLGHELIMLAYQIPTSPHEEDYTMEQNRADYARFLTM